MRLSRFDILIIQKIQLVKQLVVNKPDNPLLVVAVMHPGKQPVPIG